MFQKCFFELNRIMKGNQKKKNMTSDQNNNIDNVKMF